MRNEMNKKMIGHIRQCIGHEHDETSAHGLWTKLKEMYREKTSQNKALLRRLVLKLQRGTTMAEQTSEFQRATGRGQKKRPEKRSQEGGHRGGTRRNCPRNKAQDQSSEAATTAMMAVDESDVLLAASADEESDWISDSGIAYHLCRDRAVFSTHVACERLVRMANDAIQDEWTKEATGAHRHAKQAQEYLMDVLEGSTVEQERKEMLWDTCRSLVRHEKMQPVSYGEAGSEVVGMDNLKTTDYPQWAGGGDCLHLLLRRCEEVKNGGRQLVKNEGREWPKEELRKSSIEARISPINRNLGRKEKIRSLEKCKGLGALIGAHSRMLCAEGLGKG
ncbi:hypothetical protein Acr_10g0009610 [Actinidia rufa]|uniref:Uncharacterized protein n=1 Tax=Actinidia rufa TaxID=165716 RepID=A0A7J0FAX9_9ERIC|nr:hypothetical protein Acr_10g0009610 [Actinidia rufa]